ncbi:MAG TPA: hypothetical protein ENG32_01220 [bacterium]|nr:hypothetical protein [bacterium]
MERLVFLPLVISLLILSFFFKRGSKEILRASFLIYLLGIFLSIGISLLQASLTYFLWERNSLSHLLLPPFTPISYFLSYVFFHFFRPMLFNLSLSLLLLALLKIFNKIFRGRLFFEEEIYFASFAVLASPFPTNLLLIILVFLSGILVSLSKKTCKKKVEFTSLYHFWLPLAILMIIFKPFIITLPILKDLVM